MLLQRLSKLGRANALQVLSRVSLVLQFCNHNTLGCLLRKKVSRESQVEFPENDLFSEIRSLLILSVSHLIIRIYSNLCHRQVNLYHRWVTMSVSSHLQLSNGKI